MGILREIKNEWAHLQVDRADWAREQEKAKEAKRLAKKASR